MIYPNVDLLEWIKKYPQLKVVAGSCDGCGAFMETLRPFISRGYAGLESLPCPCGRGTTKSLTKVTTSEETYRQWAEVLAP